MWCLAEASCLLRIIMFLRLAYGHGNLFNDIRGGTSACALDGPHDVPKTDRVSVLCTVDIIRMLQGQHVLVISKNLPSTLVKE